MEKKLREQEVQKKMASDIKANQNINSMIKTLDVQVQMKQNALKSEQLQAKAIFEHNKRLDSDAVERENRRKEMVRKRNTANQ